MKVSREPNRLTVEVDSEDETDALGRALAETVVPGLVIGLVGPLGAGKTRLTRALAEALGVVPEAIASPTFVLIHEYEGRIPVYHFDTYRLRSTEEFAMLGVADYWSGGGVCLVEWADRVRDQLPKDAWMVTISRIGHQARRFEILIPHDAARLERLADRLAAFDGSHRGT